MKIELALRVFPPSQVGRLAAIGEAAGFDAVSVNETARDSIVAASVAAAATRTTEIATSVSLAFPRSPTITAMAAWDLQELSGGRFTLGLGPQVRGHIQRRFGLAWSPPAPWMREYVQALRALWRAFAGESPLDHRGDRYKLTLLTREFNPGPQPFGPPRVHLAAVGRAMSRLAGEVADGLRTHPLMTPKYLTEVTVPAIREGRLRAGRSGDPFDLIAASFQAIGDSDEEIARAREEARRMVAFYASTPSYRPVLTVHGLDDLGQKLSRMVAGGKWDQIAAEVPDDVLDVFALSGRLEDLPRLVSERYRGVITRFALFSPSAALLAEEDRLAALVGAVQNGAEPLVWD
ncbi:MAG: TIGR03617 family F420-dependent LLM class oxidoreductase [Dehalococcoidia bacterium]